MWCDHRQHQLGAGCRQDPQHRTQVGAEAAAADQGQPLAVVPMLVGELHRDAAAERLADHRRPVHPEFVEEIAQKDREGSQRVVPTRFRGHAVAEQVGRDDAVFLGQLRDDRPPGGRTAGHPVDQQQGVALAGIPVGDPVSV